MSKQRTTTIVYQDLKFSESSLDEAEFMQEMLGVKTMVGYGIAMGPLAICFLCCLPSYIGAFKRHLAAHGASPFLPLLTHSFRTLKVNYPMFFIFTILSGLLMTSHVTIMVASFLTNMAAIFALAINWYTAMYELAISILSIHRFVNNRQPKEFRANLSRKNVIVLMVLVFLTVIIKDISLMVWAFIAIFAQRRYMMYGTIIFYYALVYLTHQSLLFIGMICQFAVGSVPATSHSENVIATHTKWIGAIKFGLFLLAALSFATGIQTIIAYTLFVSVDLFLVPVVIELTEINSDPNAIAPCEPCEIKKEPLKV